MEETGRESKGEGEKERNRAWESRRGKEVDEGKRKGRHKKNRERRKKKENVIHERKKRMKK